MTGSTPSLPTGRTERRLVRTLLERGPAHRAELARELDLSRARIGTVAATLLDDGVLVELAAPVSRASDGRAGPPLGMSPDLGVVAGVQFSTSAIDVVVQTLTGETVAERHLGHEPNQHGSVAEPQFAMAGRLLAQCLDELPGRGAPGEAGVRVVGVGGFGQIDPTTGVVNTRAGGTWWQANVRELSEQTFGAPVVVENNCRLAALAEATWGAGRGTPSMLYINAGFGIMAVLVLDGRLVSGAHGGAGELGHTSFDLNGPLCYCGGRGCLAQTATAYVVQDRLKELYGQDWEALVSAAQQGDRVVWHALLDVAEVMGKVVANLANLDDPATIVIGGELLRCGPRFMERLSTEFHDHVLAGSSQAALLEATVGGRGQGGALAGALLARRQISAQLR